MAGRKRLLRACLCALGAGGCNTLAGIEQGVPYEEQQADPYISTPALTEPLPETCDDNPFLAACDFPETPAEPLVETPLPEGLARAAPLLIYEGSVSAPSFDAAMTTVKSPRGAAIAPDCSGNQTCFEGEGEVCVRGNTDAVPTLDDFSTYWGAMLQMSFEAPWSRASEEGKVAGVSFRIRGRAIPEMRLQLEAVDAPSTALEFYCRLMTASDGERVDVIFDTLQSECWTGQGASLPSSKRIFSIDWQINSELSQEKDFDFCLSDVRLIVPAP